MCCSVAVAASCRDKHRGAAIMVLVNNIRAQLDDLKYAPDAAAIASLMQPLRKVLLVTFFSSPNRLLIFKYIIELARSGRQSSQRGFRRPVDGVHV